MKRKSISALVEMQVVVFCFAMGIGIKCVGLECLKNDLNNLTVFKFLFYYYYRRRVRVRQATRASDLLSLSNSGT